MTKAFELDWKVPVPKELLDGSVFDRWTEDKDSSDIEYDCLFNLFLDSVYLCSLLP